MIPEPALLDSVHPTERITATGRPNPEFREQLAGSLANGLQNYANALAALRPPTPSAK